jgi:hypothetical protein
VKNSKVQILARIEIGFFDLSYLDGTYLNKKVVFNIFQFLPISKNGQVDSTLACGLEVPQFKSQFGETDHF